MRKFRPLFISLLVVLFFCNNVSAATYRVVEITYNVDNEAARSILNYINEWRQSGDVWCWNSDNTEKVQYGKLPAYTYDYNLEQIALQRAYEVAISFSHTRPDGSSTWSCTYNGTNSWGECIAYGYSTEKQTFEQWKEDSYYYDGQGHRRLMASPDYSAIGIAHVEYNGGHYWVQEYGFSNSGAAATTALKGTVVGTVKIDVTNATFTIVPENRFSYMDMYSTQQLPSVKGYLNTNNGGFYVPDSEISNVKWSSSDTSVLVVENKKTVKAVGNGSAALIASAVYEGQIYTYTMTVNVSKVNLYSVDCTAPTTPYDINGAKPKPVLTYNGTTLVKGKDYTITGYSNNTFIGNYAYVTVEGMGGFTGTNYADFEITKCNISNCTISGISDSYYTGSAVTHNISVTQNGTALTKGTHYSVSYSDNVNIGTAKVTITGIGNYYNGTKTISFKIKARPIGNATVNSIEDQVYTGYAVTPDVTVKDGNNTLVKGKDYTVCYKNNTNVGTATVTITGTGNYSGSINKTFNIIKKTIITSQPKDYTGIVGSTAVFGVTAQGDGLTYQWQYKSGSSWVNSGALGSKSARMTLKASDSLNGMQYRCIVKDQYGKSLTTNVVTLYVPSLPVITKQPANFTATVGSPVAFSVTVQGTGLTYQWQVYSNGTWKNSAAYGSKTSKISFNITNDHNGMKYRCVITDSYGQKVTSNVACVYVGIPLAITIQPVDYTGAAGSTATFSVSAQGTGLTYQWQYKTGSGWTNSGASGSKSAKMTLTISDSLNGMQYRCIVKDSTGKTVISNVATLRISSSISITKQPVNYTGAVGSTAEFSITAQGEGIIYQWQVYSDGAWKNSAAGGAKTSKLSFTIALSHYGKKYRCIVMDSSGEKIVSNSVTVIEPVPLSITKQPVNYTGAVGSTAEFSITAQGEDLTYQWQVYSGGVWKKSSASGSTTSKLSFNLTNSHDGMKYRCVVMDNTGEAVISNTVSVKLPTPLSITKQPVNFTGTVGSTAEFSITAQGEGLIYQWQVYSDGAWKNSAAGGAKTSKLTFNVTDSHNGMKYRCIVKDSSGEKIVSNSVTVKEPVPLAITKQPANFTGSVGSTAEFSITAQGEGLIYQWQVYSDGAWKNSAAGGAKTSKLSFSVTNSHNGMKYRCIVKDSSGEKVVSNSVTVKTGVPSSNCMEPADVAMPVNETAPVTITNDAMRGIENADEEQLIAEIPEESNALTNDMIEGIESEEIEDKIQLPDYLGSEESVDEISEGNGISKGPSVITQPESVKTKAGEKVTFTVEAEGQGLRYQWQYCKNGEWIDLDIEGADTAEVILEITEADNGMQYRCVVADFLGNAVITDIVDVTII